SAPISSPVFTFGQDTFSSTAAISERELHASRSSAISAAVEPITLVINGTGKVASAGRSSARYPASPLFGSPIELTSPPGASHNRGGGLPERGSNVIVLDTYAANGNPASGA